MDAPHVYVCAWALFLFFYFFSTVILLPKPVKVDVLDPDTDISGYFALNFSNCLRVVRLCRGSVLYSVLQVWSDSREVRISLGFPLPTRWGICHEEWHSYGLSADSSGFQRIISLSKREESIIYSFACIGILLGVLAFQLLSVQFIQPTSSSPSSTDKNR